MLIDARLILPSMISDPSGEPETSLIHPRSINDRDRVYEPDPVSSRVHIEPDAPRLSPIRDVGYELELSSYLSSTSLIHPHRT